MKITIAIDEPDTLREGIMDCAEEAAAELIARKGSGLEGASESEIESVEWAARDRAEAALAAWWGDNGVARLEFDLDAGTARVLRRDGRDADGAERLLAAICDALPDGASSTWPLYPTNPLVKAVQQAQKERGKTWGKGGAP